MKRTNQNNQDRKNIRRWSGAAAVALAIIAFTFMPKKADAGLGCYDICHDLSVVYHNLAASYVQNPDLSARFTAAGDALYHSFRAGWEADYNSLYAPIGQRASFFEASVMTEITLSDEIWNTEIVN